jgi:hypothetical protein
MQDEHGRFVVRAGQNDQAGELFRRAISKVIRGRAKREPDMQLHVRESLDSQVRNWAPGS